jgi:response regulator NasT
MHWHMPCSNILAMKKVLILDDRLLTGGDLPKRLTELGFAVVRDNASVNGLAERVERASPDIVVMGGTVLGGSAAAEEISSIAPKPIVLLPEVNGRNKGESANRGGYVLIPFDAPEVGSALQLAAAGIAELSSLQKENEGLKKTLEARKMIERAKGVLMKNRDISEAEAFSLIQKKSMDLRKPMVDIAHAILLAEEVNKQEKAS